MKRALFLILSILMLSGCASTLSNVKENEPLIVSSDKSVVFGKVSFYMPSGAECKAMFINVKTNKFYEIQANDGPFIRYTFFEKNKNFKGYVEKTFYIALPPGDYRFTTLRFMEYNQNVSDVYPKIDFSVSPNAIVYIGTLKLTPKDMHNYILFSAGHVNIAIYDEKDNAIKELKEKYPSLNGEVVTSLMKILSNKKDKGGTTTQENKGAE
ncbi:MAG: hypothetical protein PHS46_02480 [Candidatus Omnitrophica bacterium]|nr:hypothetical protein [Candidatus Omnitrophota bacterium]